MEEWELDFEFLKVRHHLKDNLKLDKLPELKVMLLLIGVQELGKGPQNFTKEEKQDLMHIAVCRLLEQDGYYEFVGQDADGWPHWDIGIPFKTKGVAEQEKILKEKIIQYFSLEKDEQNLN